MSGMGFCQEEWASGGVFHPGVIPNDTHFKKKFRWKLIIPDISASGVNSLPPAASARPAITFKEMTAEHLNETISFPSKPEWKPIQLTLYDICKGETDGMTSTSIENPVFTWLRRQYDTRPENCAYWKPALGNPPTFTGTPSFQSGKNFKVAEMSLIMYDGCENPMEIWVYEHVFPTNIDWGDLDMSNSEVAKVDITLRYDRAYIETPGVPTNNLDYPQVLSNFQCSPSQIPSFVPPSVVPLFGNDFSFQEIDLEPVEFIQMPW